VRPDEWHLTEDVDDFLARAGGFLRSRPALHTLTLTATLRTDGANTDAVFGWLETRGEVSATFYRIPPRRLILTSLTPGQADALAGQLAGHPLPGVSADRETAAAFAEAWQRHTGATPTLLHRLRLYRLGTLTPPQPAPEGRARVADDHEQLRLWCNGFAEAVGQAPHADVESWARRYASKRFTFWETPDGTPVSIAATTPLIAGQSRVDPVYTPAHLSGRGYGGAVTAAVSRAALAAGAAEVVLFSDLSNPSSNSLYQRIGYVPVTDFAVYGF
jgi:predicted GNAT family acetyltransferase